MDQNLNQYDGNYNNGGNNQNRGQDNQNGQGGPGGNGGDPKKQSLIILVIAALITLFSISMFMKFMTGSTNQEISYNEFIEMIEKDEIKSVVVDSDRITIQPKQVESNNPFVYVYGGGTTYYTGKMEDDDKLTARLLEHDIVIKKQVADSSSVIITILLYYVLPILLMWGLLSLLFRKMGKGGPMGVGKSNAKVYVQKETGITFQDVAGEDEAKESLVEVVDFLHNPGKYSKIGARLPKAHCWSDRPEPVKHFWPKRWREKRMFLFSLCPVLISSSYMSASEPPVSATCSKKRRKTRPVSFSSMKSTPSAEAVTPNTAAGMKNGNRR